MSITDNEANELKAQVSQLQAEIQQFRDAMEREQAPKWSDGLKLLAKRIEDGGTGTDAVDDRRRAARELRYMADCFTLKANFVPSNLRIKELEAREKEVEWLIKNMPMGYFSESTPEEHKERRHDFLTAAKTI